MPHLLLLPPQAAARYQPAAVVLLAGTGLLSGDRLGCMNVTLGGYSKAVECVLALRRRRSRLVGGARRERRLFTACSREQAYAASRRRGVHHFDRDASLGGGDFPRVRRAHSLDAPGNSTTAQTTHARTLRTAGSVCQ